MVRDPTQRYGFCDICQKVCDIKLVSEYALGPPQKPSLPQLTEEGSSNSNTDEDADTEKRRKQIEKLSTKSKRHLLYDYHDQNEEGESGKAKREGKGNAYDESENFTILPSRFVTWAVQAQ